MLKDIINRSRLLGKVKNFFPDKDLPEDFSIPSSTMLYCTEYDHPKTIVNPRYMLTIPFVDLTYHVEHNQYLLHCGQALLTKPYLHRSVPHLHENYLRLIVSFKLSGEQIYLPKYPVMTMTAEAWKLVDLLLGHYERKEIIPTAFSLTLLLHELAQNAIKTDIRETSPRIIKILHYINQYPEQLCSTQEVASKFGISSSHLRRQFKNEVGISFGKYLGNIRLNVAKGLLVDTRLRIDEVGFNCGYDSIYSFSRFFKKSTGISPLGFRKQYTKKL